MFLWVVCWDPETKDPEPKEPNILNPNEKHMDRKYDHSEKYMGRCRQISIGEWYESVKIDSWKNYSVVRILWRKLLRRDLTRTGTHIVRTEWRNWQWTEETGDKYVMQDGFECHIDSHENLKCEIWLIFK